MRDRRLGDRQTSRRWPTFTTVTAGATSSTEERIRNAPGRSRHSSRPDSFTVASGRGSSARDWIRATTRRRSSRWKIRPLLEGGQVVRLLGQVAPDGLRDEIRDGAVAVRGFPLQGPVQVGVQVDGRSARWRVVEVKG